MVGRYARVNKISRVLHGRPGRQPQATSQRAGKQGVGNEENRRDSEKKSLNDRAVAAADIRGVEDECSLLLWRRDFVAGHHPLARTPSVPN